MSCYGRLFWNDIWKGFPGGICVAIGYLYSFCSRYLVEFWEYLTSSATATPNSIIAKYRDLGITVKNEWIIYAV